ncbi:hypothetical protein H2O64_00960 [Kordia sp. YSTF-M3]|uniref:DUF1850 domain-containing protein n=1 Tax=Kordia aestuariivivens TaxID=2759037 RepID=A0ABR7Q444_9FLAO|nr:hypothetical protein [Kordia aestuariivivens]MBC8753218.1 hypothetical protein [Kordia aestuariivivens]
MKRIIIIGFFLAACIYILFFINREIVVLWKLNSITIRVEAPLLKEKITVEYAMSTKFYKDDIDFLKNTDYVLVFDGIDTKAIPHNYGENDFIISYENQYYVPFRHFKTKRQHQHDYIFYLYEKEDGLYVRIMIDGPDEMNFEAKMIAIPIKKTSIH